MNSNYLTAIKAAVDAGKEILKVYNSHDIQIKYKQDNSPCTSADRKAHDKIMEYLLPTNIPILSEEGKEIPFEFRKDWEQLWIVDPLDGTKEFIERNGEYTVNIALVRNGSPVFGVIYVPATNELFVGINELGAFKYEGINNPEAIGYDLSKFLDKCKKLPIKLDRAFTVVVSRSHFSKETEDFINKLKIEHHNLVFISKGSSLKFCALAEGRADVYPRFAPTMEWDTAAGQAIVEASGGKVTKVDGTPVEYNKHDLLNPWFIVS